MHDASSPPQVAQGLWTALEHERFLMALRLYPEGPWKDVADMIGTRNAKQAQAHMQKCKEKLYRRIRELQSKLEHDDGHSSSDSDGGYASSRTQRTKHADTLGIQVLHPIPFDIEPTDGFLCRGASMRHTATGHELSVEESLDFLINEMKSYVEGE
ncbi:hypothetical protein SPRG_14210 [Saprolegnia parasitica CBS 223.65]|uniref:HTH myb-type domain-containing protein n=1 Tax=Saprolegnia parasitica (strain CBS 223.65) TaxID=695850 RepID=A0A067BZR7_SAPPC|nr:hypothetical protein SPRG_14210 [Saprolegnia parasitica CBS 223.65]KDO20062.1 hypothetical protein SPRG_14210 [Saprolegnia parasitica CBS 223.65]|eukprot:XP_012209223.1 hypothetical protein SPRG_14210 [Saprolegnia parasitica CBS 223.65]